MKLRAYHDNRGNIVGFAVSPTDDLVGAEIVPEAHPAVRGVDVAVPSEVHLDPDNLQQLNEALGKLMENYRVDNGELRSIA